ncbi:kinase A anchor protein [Suillus clintonianus]|uniref:kinase A anchor protein n=1 Tax=Suillus clintonianus TaxID=1904413 RepID=UPI001B86476B|nr:kinase A anchor protein [Suillus clintonianus]KAG2123083.1 kinase A anchor protein [Suillus clintonianus]
MATKYTARASTSTTRGGQFSSGTNRNSKLRPTHFISLPIGHHVRLQESVKSFTDGLLDCKPALPGVDRGIVIAPRRLHLTLGVMTLEDSLVSSGKTLANAQALLGTLRSRIMELLNGHSLCIPLTDMNIMYPDRGNADNAHVLWLGPSLDTENAQRLKTVSEFVNKAFSDAGFIQDRRPLKLHCTILNTSFRKPHRQPFSYNAILASPAIRGFVSSPLESHDFRDPVKVDFGTWSVDEIQICKMGSYGPEGEYVSCGCCSLAS